MEILSARSRASNIGCGGVDDAAVQAERDHTIVSQLPDLSIWVRRPTSLLHQRADCHVGEGDLKCADLVMGEARPWRFPLAFGDDELDGFEPLLQPRIVAIADAEQAVTLLRKELLRCSRTREVEEPGARRDGVARAEAGADGDAR
jgi:hypothetical protein